MPQRKAVHFQITIELRLQITIKVIGILPWGYRLIFTGGYYENERNKQIY